MYYTKLIEAYVTPFPECFRVIAQCLAHFIEYSYKRRLPFSNFHGKDYMKELMPLLENAVLDDGIDLLMLGGLFECVYSYFKGTPAIQFERYNEEVMKIWRFFSFPSLFASFLAS